MGLVYTNDLCIGCNKCIRACSCMGACIATEEEGSARINVDESKCINCGACMAACPFGAISDKSLIVPVAKALSNKEKIYATVAPAIAGQFGMKVKYGQIKNAIKKLGFVDMVEAACGADAVTVHESNEFVERMERGDKYMTNSCCPGFHSYIEKVFPDQVDRISGTVSPMVAAGRYIKMKDKDAKVVFIGPCTAKKSEAAKKNLKDSTDYVITFEELAALFEAFDINPAECEDEVVDEASTFGRGFGALGGLTAAIQNYVKDKNIDIEFKPVKASGPDEIKRTMTMAKVGKMPGNFIEGMMCEGGCINGASKITPTMKAKGKFMKENMQASRKSVLADEKIEEFTGINLEK